MAEGLTVGGYKVFYAYETKNVPDLEGTLKIGDATVHPTDPSVKPEEIPDEALEKAVRKRIETYTKTPGVVYDLKHFEIAVTPTENGTYRSYRDYDVHRLLKASGIQQVNPNDNPKAEFYRTNLDFLKDSIKAVKTGNFDLGKAKTVVLREEQKDAVAQTLRSLKRGSVEKPVKMLWNAKMRFGKTLAAYSLLRDRKGSARFKKVLIISHRPNDVAQSWFSDYQLLGLGTGDTSWAFASKSLGLSSFEEVSQNENFIYFASIQDLRGGSKGAACGVIDDGAREEIDLTSKSVSEEEISDFKESNRALFDTDWDLVITDEAHVGSTTKLARRMFSGLKTPYFLDLSGTPFNILQADETDDRYDYGDNIYSWTYIDERRAKKRWAEANPETPNPYDSLPEMVFLTYDISKVLESLTDDATIDAGLTELFRTITKTIEGQQVIKFRHEKEILDLLYKMKGRDSDDPRMFPFSGTYGDLFQHTLWMLPSVGACMAMEQLLKSPMSPFEGYTVINATGMGLKNEKALSSVQRAIKESGREGRTITLSYNMLTTGVSIPEWTAVFMLNNSADPKAYMQTSFRAATPGTLPNGMVKKRAYVFDFHPTRALEQVAKVATLSEPSGSTRPVREIMEEWADYLTVITEKGSTFASLSASELLEEINRAFVDEIVYGGFDSKRLWDNEALNARGLSRQAIMAKLRALSGLSGPKNVEVVPLTDEQKEALKRAKGKKKENPKAELSEEELAAIKAEKAVSNENKKRDSKFREFFHNVLVGVSARIPMFIMASPTEEEITVESFPALFDDRSWKEFMPKELGRIKPEVEADNNNQESSDEISPIYWDDIKEFFNGEVFRQACSRIISLSEQADSLTPVARTINLAEIFGTFGRPDKETVLTPYRVVEKQYISTLGGIEFLDHEGSTSREPVVKMRNIGTGEIDSLPLLGTGALIKSGEFELVPRWQDSEALSKGQWGSRDLSFYDINSKTALYPLYAATAMWWVRSARFVKNIEADETGPQNFYNLPTFSSELGRRLWEYIVSRNIFLNCRVPYSKRLAIRVLGGAHPTPELLEALEKNITVVDVAALVMAVKHWDGLKVIERPENYAKVESVSDFVGKILRVANQGFMETRAPWLAAKESYSGLLETLREFFVMIDEGEGIFETVSFVERFGNLKKELSEFLEDEELPLFSAVVGNPPYTISAANGSSRNKSIGSAIYPDFFEISYKIAKKSSIISPARWLTSPDSATKAARLTIENEKLSKNFPIITVEEDSDNIFADVGVAGGISWFLFDRDYDGLTKFIVNGEENEKRALLGPFGTIDIHKELPLLKTKLKEKLNEVKGSRAASAPLDKNPVRDWLDEIQNAFLEKFSNASTSTMVENSTSERVTPNDTRLRIPGKHGWRYLSKGFLSDRAKVPDGKFAIVFTHASHHSGDSLNDRTFFLTENETAKSTMAVYFDTAQTAINFYKFSRTKLFRILVESRLSSHNTYPQAYQDIPWMFSFDENDPIDWGVSIEEIDAELEEFFDLSEVHDFIQAAPKPFAALLDAESLSKAAESGVDVSNLGEWY